MLKTKEEIKVWLDEMNISNYTINNDLTVDVAGNVILSGNGLSKIPVQFGTVHGDFMMSHNKVTSLEGVPQIVMGNLQAMHCGLNTLKGASEIVHGSCYFAGNNLKNLKYAPQNIRGNLICDGNQLTSLRNEMLNVEGIIYADYLKEFEPFYDEERKVVQVTFSQIKDYYKSESVYKKLNKKLDNKSASKKVKL